MRYNELIEGTASNGDVEHLISVQVRSLVSLKKWIRFADSLSFDPKQAKAIAAKRDAIFTNLNRIEYKNIGKILENKDWPTNKKLSKLSQKFEAYIDYPEMNDLTENLKALMTSLMNEIKKAPPPFVEVILDETKNNIDKIKAECAPYLSVVNDNIVDYGLFRGFYNAQNNRIGKSKVNLKDRKPVDSAYELHEKYNKYFTQKFGAPFRNAMFVSGSLGTAMDYGKPHLIFPIGKFEFIWSRRVEDLFQIEDQAEMAVVSNGDRGFEEYMSGLEWQNTDLNAAISSNNEIMIRCSSYYWINLAGHPGHNFSAKRHNIYKVLQEIQDLL